MNPGLNRPVEPFPREIESLEFRTDFQWSVNDLSVALAAFDGIYLAILLARHLAVEAQRNAERLAEDYERAWRGVEAHGPAGEFFLYEWSRLVRRLGPAAFRLPFFGGAAASYAGSSSGRDLVERYLSNPSTYIEPADELLVERIQMASPGGFNLKGLGEPLRELRELIKDLWYRNQQERRRGEFELIKEKLQLAAQYRLNEPQLNELSVVVLSDVEDMKPLIDKGKLILPDSPQLPGPPEKASVTKRRPRRRSNGS